MPPKSASPNTFKGCPETGLTKSGKLPSKENQRENRLKNRNAAPTKINKKVTLAAMLKAGSDIHRWSNSDGAEITGYLVGMKSGGDENCNCHNKAYALRDTHLELVQDFADKVKRKRVIVELTPRFKQFHSDWSMTALKKHLGKKIKVRGWMFFDEEHKDESENTNPGVAKNWRATAWEIHPVTSLKVLS